MNACKRNYRWGFSLAGTALWEQCSVICVIFFMECLIFESFDEFVEHDSQQDNDEGSNPVAPVVFGEGAVQNAWCERMSLVQ